MPIKLIPFKDNSTGKDAFINPNDVALVRNYEDFCVIYLKNELTVVCPEDINVVVARLKG